jgi:signal transduction histidine kinase
LVQLRILHDSALQVLEAIGSGRYTDVGVIRRLAETEANRLYAELTTGGHEDAQLAPRLRQIIDEVETSAFAVALDVEPIATPLPPAVVSALCAACREALTNVIKHAGVSNATVVLRPHSAAGLGGVSLSVQDHGRGFDPASRNSGFGMTQSMRQRIEDVDGKWSLQSLPGKGTTVIFEWPR